jgi:drug/metabolite transporter (DMT)-like permease
VSRKAGLLFAVTSVIWGSSFLFIRPGHRLPGQHCGAATASVITYVMPVVALALGVGLLGERFTIGAVVGMALIMLGAWLAPSRQRSPAADPRGVGKRDERALRSHGATAASVQGRRDGPAGG